MTRVALYFSPSERQISHADLQPYFARAQAEGLRIVTAKQEAPRADSYRPVLGHLLDRIGAGEFDLVWSVVGHCVAHPRNTRVKVR